MPSVTAAELTTDERARYSDQGFFARERVFAEAELEALRAAAERVVATAERASDEKTAAISREEARSEDD